MVQVVVPDDAMHLCWTGCASAPFEVKECSIINGKVSEGDVLLPFGWTADLLVKCVVRTSAID